MNIPPTPDIFAVLFFNDLVRDGWSVEIEPSMSRWSQIEGRVSVGCTVRFEKGDTQFSGEGHTLDQAIINAKTQIEQELGRIQASITKLRGEVSQ